MYQTTSQNVSQHLRAIQEEGELRVEATCKRFLQVRVEGEREVRREIRHYSLDAILAVGYRVRSARGTQFRIWATERLCHWDTDVGILRRTRGFCVRFSGRQHGRDDARPSERACGRAALREYLVKGFTVDDERLRNPSVEGSGAPDYFDELLERIRDIRASERRVFLRVREIFALAADHDPKRPEVVTFFRTIQNKMHYAATGKTAAELIVERANHALPNLGLTTWRGDRARKVDVTIEKNEPFACAVGWNVNPDDSLCWRAEPST